MINETLPFCLVWSIEKKNGTAGGTQLSLDNVRPEQQKMSLFQQPGQPGQLITTREWCRWNREGSSQKMFESQVWPESLLVTSPARQVESSNHSAHP